MNPKNFKSQDELKRMKVVDIKSHIREFNKHYAIKGYSKMKKDELIKAVGMAQMRVKPQTTQATKPPLPSKPKKKINVTDLFKILTPQKEGFPAAPPEELIDDDATRERVIKAAKLPLGRDAGRSFSKARTLMKLGIRNAIKDFIKGKSFNNAQEAAKAFSEKYPNKSLDVLKFIPKSKLG